MAALALRAGLDERHDLFGVVGEGEEARVVGGDHRVGHEALANPREEAAPEAGVKFFVNSTTFIQFSAEYQFFFDSHSSGREAFSNGEFVYGLNIGFKWH